MVAAGIYPRITSRVKQSQLSEEAKRRAILFHIPIRPFRPPGQATSLPASSPSWKAWRLPQANQTAQKHTRSRRTQHLEPLCFKALKKETGLWPKHFAAVSRIVARSRRSAWHRRPGAIRALRSRENGAMLILRTRGYAECGNADLFPCRHAELRHSLRLCSVL